MKTIVVIGAGGMLGYALTEYFASKHWNVVGLTRTEYNIAADPMEKLASFAAGADYCVNAAGVIKPRIAGTPVEDVVRVNSIFPRNLSRFCRSRGISLVHITTDCVYSGKRGGYTEEDTFDAEDLYGLSKCAGEPGDCMVLRTSIIGEERGQSRSLLEWARSSAGKDVSGFTNHRWNGVTTFHLAELLRTIFLEGHYREGTTHLHSPQAVTKFELLNAINDVYGLSLRISAAEATVPCDRSLASILPLSRSIATKSIRVQLEEMRGFFDSRTPALQSTGQGLAVQAN